MKRAFVQILLGLVGICSASPRATVGDAEIFPDVMFHATRLAVPFTMPEDGTIESITIYHQGGTGAMLLGIYVGDRNPTIRVAVTRVTPVHRREGWQTTLLSEPVWIPGGTQIWLSWVFESNPGVRSQAQCQEYSESAEGWTAGMPLQSKAVPHSVGAYSIYATYVRHTRLVINEVVLRNDMITGSTYLDEDGTKQGWIELYNPGDLAVPLDGYWLSDDRDILQKWPLPSVALGAKEFLLIWGSGKDRRDPAAPFHTSFSIMASESLYLTYADAEEATMIDVLQEVKIPIDHSLGRYPDGCDQWHVYRRPTPGYVNSDEDRRPFAIHQRNVSLSVGVPYQMTVVPRETSVIWSSDSPIVWVDPAGGLLATEDAMGEKSRATVFAESIDGTYVDSCEVTIVNWTANLSELKILATQSSDQVLGAQGDALFHTRGRELYVTNDGMTTSTLLCTLPEMPVCSSILATPFGFFLRCNKTIYRSDDLVQWRPTLATNHRGLLHGLDWHWEESSQIGYFYVAEYSVDPNCRHALYRGIFKREQDAEWTRVLEFASPAEWESDRSILDAARHIHTVAVDPYTGHVWVGTGDTDAHARLLYSCDHGKSFSLIGMGSQAYRVLSIWFTEHYVYWSMDSERPQSIWRVSRSRCERENLWPTLTPELASGMTKPGVRYYITASETEGYFPETVGGFYRETIPRSLDERNRVRAIDDPEYDCKEEIAQLFNGSLWYHLWVTDDYGDPILLLGGAAEGAQRDYRGRVFGIKELPDGSVDVQELLAVNSIRPDTYDSSTRYVQLEPRAQGADGSIYFTGRYTPHRVYRTQLVWTDNTW